MQGKIWTRLRPSQGIRKGVKEMPSSYICVSLSSVQTSAQSSEGKSAESQVEAPSRHGGTHPNRKARSAPHAGVSPPASGRSSGERIQCKITVGVEQPRASSSDGWKAILALERCRRCSGYRKDRSATLRSAAKAAASGGCNQARRSASASQYHQSP